MGDTFSTVGDDFSTVGDNISTVEVAQYSGDKDLKYYEFSKNLEIFPRAYFAAKSDRPHRRQYQACGGITAVHVGDNISTWFMSSSIKDCNPCGSSLEALF